MSETPGVPVVSDDVLRIRKERVHTTMLIELLVLLVFLSMTYAFVSKDESKTSKLQIDLDKARTEIRSLKGEVGRLKVENRSLAEANEQLRISLARWQERPRDSIPAADLPIVIPKAQLKQLTDRLANAEAKEKEQRTENSVLRRELIVAKGGGTDRPNCSVTAGFLVRVDLMADGRLRTSPAWMAGAADEAARVPGVAELVAGRELDIGQFSRLAAKTDAWAKAQPTPCGFRAQVSEHHSNLGLYKRQVRAVENYFYVRRN